MQRKKKIAIGAVVSVAAALIFTGAVLPQIVKSRATEAIQEATGRGARIGAVSINPFTLTMTVDDLAVLERGEAPLLAIRRVQASVSTASIFRRALVLDGINIDRPQLSFARIAPNRYSFSDIIDKLSRKKSQKSGTFLFSLNNIVIRDGSVDFRDAAVGSGTVHTVRKLEVGIPFISNIPYYADSYVSPKITAVVNGTPFTLQGKTKPFSRSMETSLHLGLQRLSIPQYLAYSPVAPPVDLNSGLLTLDADLKYKVASDKKPELALSGVLRLDDTEVQLKGGKPLVKLPLLEVRASKLDLAAQRYAFSSVLLDGLQLFVSRDRGGEWMYAPLVANGRKEREKDAEGKGKDAASPPLPVEVASLVLKDGAIRYEDRLPKGGFAAQVSAIEGVVNGFSTTGTGPASYRLGLSLDGHSGFQSTGTFSPAAAAFSGKVALTDLELGRSWPYLAPYLTAPVQGRLDVSSDVAYSREGGLVAENGKLALRKVSTRYGKSDRLELGTLAAAGGSYRQKLNRLEISDVTLSRGSAAVSRAADGALSVQSLVRKDAGTASKARPKEAPAKGKVAAAPPHFSYRIGKIQVDGVNVSFTDKSRDGEPVFTLKNTRLSLANLTGPRFSPSPLRFSSTFGKHAPVAANGVLVAAPFSYSGSVKVGRLPLRDFEDYLPDNVNVFVVAGVLDADLKVALALKDGRPAGTFRGSAGVRDFHSMDSVAEQDLLKWESLQFDGIRGEIAPFALDIRQIALNNLYSRIIVRPDGTLNLQNLVAKEAAGAEAAKAPQAAPVAPAGLPSRAVATAAAPAATAAPRRISIGAVTIQEGTVAFSDFHLPQPFATTFYHLGGRVSGLSSEEQKHADVDLRGNLENRSPLQITGRINPLREDLLVDLKISFRDIELPGVSPYSGTYLGYRVDRGKLFLDLKYLIEKKQLNSENKVFIDQFNFGEKVESDKATDLPVRLAVALLKDKNGEIHLDLPVTGRTDDPQFSVWGTVWQVVKNLFAKAATSPFALLSSVFGGGSDLSSVAFAPGASHLSQTEGEKLQKLATALSDRPAIRLEVSGFIDPEKDPEGYRVELLKKKMKGEKFLQLAKEKRLTAGQTAESLEILPEEHTRLLKAVYEKEKFPKPRTVVGTLKALPDGEMTKLILANTTVKEADLRALAHDRCAAVTAFLVGAGKLPQERVFEKSGNIYAAAKEGVTGARVEFGVAAK